MSANGKDLSFPDMAKIKINIERCKGCGICVSVCPIDNLRMSANMNKSGHKHVEVIDEAKCTGCALCCQMCPDVVIEIVEQLQKAATVPTESDV